MDDPISDLNEAERERRLKELMQAIESHLPKGPGGRRLAFILTIAPGWTFTNLDTDDNEVLSYVIDTLYNSAQALCDKRVRQGVNNEVPPRKRKESHRTPPQVSPDEVQRDRRPEEGGQDPQ